MVGRTIDPAYPHMLLPLQQAELHAVNVWMFAVHAFSESDGAEVSST